MNKKNERRNYIDYTVEPKRRKQNLIRISFLTLSYLVVIFSAVLIFILKPNTPTFDVQGGKIGDVKGGDATNNNTINYGSGTNQNGNGNQGSGSSSSQEPSSKTSQSSPASSSTQKVDVTATNVVWTLTYPVYRLEKDKCSWRGKDSVNLIQTKGSLYFGGGTNGYGDTSIRGTITSTGQVNLSLSGNKGGIDFVTFEGANPQVDLNLNATVITGKVTVPNCPDDKFRLSKGS